MCHFVAVYQSGTFQQFIELDWLYKIDLITTLVSNITVIKHQ